MQRAAAYYLVQDKCLQRNASERLQLGPRREHALKEAKTNPSSYSIPHPAHIRWNIGMSLIKSSAQSYSISACIVAQLAQFLVCNETSH